MTSTDFYAKLTSINFIVKNISPQRKKLTIFNYPLEFGQSRDLFTIPEITEDDIRSSLVKGELANKIRAGDIRIVSSSINLLQFDDQQKAFIENALESPETTPGVDPGAIGGSGNKIYNLTIADSPFTIPNTDNCIVFIPDGPFSPPPLALSPNGIIAYAPLTAFYVILPDDPFLGQIIQVFCSRDMGGGANCITSNVKNIMGNPAPYSIYELDPYRAFIFTYDGVEWRATK